MTELEQAIRRGLARTPVVVGYLLGSRARGTERGDSDTDLGCLLPASRPRSLAVLAEIAVALEEAGVPTPDVHLLNDAALAFQAEAVLHGRRVYCPDVAVAVGYEVFVTTRYLDFEPILQMQYRIQRRRIQAEGVLGPAPRR